MRIRAVVLAGIIGCAFGTEAVANDTGYATSTHPVRREGGRLCIVGHTHGGSGGGGTKAVALIGAINAFVTTTNAEYGSDWAKWAKAASKRVTYTKAGDTWMANAEARPCR
ncbi:MAG: hypothetical protein ABL897_07330 [Hyphomicrobium sp.]